MELISKMFLLSGKDLELAPNIVIRHPTVQNILNINNGFLCEDYYWTYVFTMLSDPYDFMVYLDDNKIDFEKTSAFDVFLLRWNDAQKDYMTHSDRYQKLGSSPLSIIYDSLSFFFGQRDFGLNKIGDQIVIVDTKDDTWAINKDAFDLATSFIMKCNCIVRTDKIKPASPGAKRILIEDKRMEENKKQSAIRKISEEKPERIAEAIATLDAGLGVTELYDKLPIYRLLSTAHSVQRRIVVQSILNGIYTGMIKSDGVSDKELRWV